MYRRSADYLATHAPPGSLGSSGAEAGLARVCWALDAYEGLYRGGSMPDELARLTRARTVPSVEQLRAMADEETVSELVALVARLRESGSLTALQQHAGNPPAGHSLGTAAPTFVEHWADGDLIVGDTLIDVKTVMRLDKPERTARWLWQLLAYAWLDTTDTYRIRSVGLYFARHGTLVTWNLQSFASHLLDEAGRIEHARREFLQVASRVIRTEWARSAPRG
ncbi:hypothetical protein [Actinopolyspora erythraea]|uniref:hypothetical protein n=1 Tax=Actinopolyspora erythraea TaxID=414996 RepID=UPI001185FBB5|nr:hypothetical protein [Actinopolyspora erythraea]